MADRVRVTVTHPAKRRDGTPEPPTMTFIRAAKPLKDITFHGPQFPNLPKEPKPEWLEAMHGAYVQVANEHHQERLKRVYAALRKAVSRG